MINAFLLLVWAAGVHFFVIIQLIRQSIMCLLRQSRLTSTDTHAHTDRYERSHRPLRTLTSTDVRHFDNMSAGKTH